MEGQEREEREKEERERQEREEETGRTEAQPKRGLISKLKIRYLEHQRDQVIKAISRTHKKEMAIDAGDDTPERKEIRTWRQQGKRKKLLKKQQKMEERIRCKREKWRDDKKVGLFSRMLTGFFEGPTYSAAAAGREIPALTLQTKAYSDVTSWSMTAELQRPEYLQPPGEFTETTGFTEGQAGGGEDCDEDDDNSAD